MNEKNATEGNETAKKKRTPFSIQRIAIIVVVCIFVVGCVFLYFMNIQRNREYLTEHNLRHLGTITTMIQERIDAFRISIENLKMADPEDLASETITANFPFAKNAEYLVKPQTAWGLDTLVMTPDSLLYFLAPDRIDTSVIKVSTTFPTLFEAFQITEQTFDVLLITDADCDTVYYQDSPAGVTVSSLDSVNVDGDMRTIGELAKHTSAGQIQLAGRSYEFYLQIMGRFRVCALLESETFDAKAQAMPGDHVVIALIVLALLLLAIPLVNLNFKRVTDRVRKNDMVMSAVSVLFGTMLLTLCIAYIVYLKYDAEGRERAFLEDLAGSIEQRVYAEFDSVDAMVAAVDTLRNNNSGLKSRSSIFANLDKTDTVFLAYPYFEQLYWLDADGDMRSLWTTTAQEFRRMELSDREYFREVYENGRKNWIQPHYSRSSSEFMVAYSASSHISLKEETAKSKAETAKSKADTTNSDRDTAVVVSVDFLPKSLVNVYMPYGYGYMLIDGAGTVLFHSVLQRNLHENLFTECDNEKLRATVRAGVRGFAHTRYWENDVLMHVFPLKIREQQWYGVVYANDQSRTDIAAGSLVMSIVLYLLFCIPLLAAWVVFRVVRKEQVAWLWFQEKHAPQYTALASVCTCVAVLSLLIGLLASQTPTALLLIVIISHVALLMVFRRLDSESYPNGRISVSSPADASDSGDAHTVDARPVIISRMIRRLHPRNVVILVHVIALVILVTMFLRYTDNFSDMDFEIIPALLTAAALVIIFGSRRIATRLASKKHTRWNHARGQYLWMMITMTLMLTVVPVFIFFRISVDVYRDAHNRETIAHGSMSLEEREQRIRHTFGSKHIPSKEDPDCSRACDTIASLFREDATDLYFDGRCDAGLEDGDWRPDTPRFAFGEELLDVFMLPLSRRVHRLSALMGPGFAQRPVSTGGEQMYFVSHPERFDVLPEKGGFSLVVLSVLLLLLLYFMIRYVTKRLFFTDIVRRGQVNPFQQKENYLCIWATDEDRRDIVCRWKPRAAMTDAERMERLREWKRYVDLADEEVDEKTWLQSVRERIRVATGFSGRIIIDSFEFRYDNASFNRMKLELIEELLLSRNMSVFIICSVEPEYYFFEQTEKTESENMQLRWRHALGMLVRMYARTIADPAADGHSLAVREDKSCSKKCKMEPDGRTPPGTWKLFNLLGTECKRREMRKIAGIAAELIKSDRLTSPGDLLLWIGRNSRPLYQAIWMTCTKRQRLVLYHIAQDGFASFQTRDIVQQLIQRRLVTTRPTLRLVNESFRNFVLSMQSVERIQLWEQEEPAGFWEYVKYPIIIGSVIIAVVLFTNNPDYFNSTVAILTALAGAIPLLLRLRGIAGGGGGE